MLQSTLMTLGQVHHRTSPSDTDENMDQHTAELTHSLDTYTSSHASF